jgi:hypothetical protein
MVPSPYPASPRRQSTCAGHGVRERASGYAFAMADVPDRLHERAPDELARTAGA